MQNTLHQSPSTPLDELDFSLLALLQQDGRMSFTDLAEKSGASIGTIRTRVTRMLEEKTLQVVGRIDPEKVGFHSYARIKIAIRPARLFDNAANALLKLREVSFLAVTSGEYDLEVDVMCRDNNHLLSTLNDSICAIEGVYATKTDMYFKVLKYAQPDLKLIR